jgi:hypothetical protein
MRKILTKTYRHFPDSHQLVAFLQQFVHYGTVGDGENILT